MILKPGEGAEPKDPALAETLRSQWNLLLHQRLFRNRRKAASRANGERTVSQRVDDLLRASNHWIALHEVRFKWRGRLAHIDHLLVNRRLEIQIVHARLIQRRTRCRNGIWEAHRHGKWMPIASPVEHCRRQLFVLRKIVENERLVPHHHGVPLPTSFKNLILVGRDFTTTDCATDDTRIWNLDTLALELRSEAPQIGTFFTTLPMEILQAFCQRLLAWHHHDTHAAA